MADVGSRCSYAAWRAADALPGSVATSHVHVHVLCARRHTSSEPVARLPVPWLIASVCMATLSVALLRSCWLRPACHRRGCPAAPAVPANSTDAVCSGNNATSPTTHLAVSSSSTSTALTGASTHDLAITALTPSPAEPTADSLPRLPATCYLHR